MYTVFDLETTTYTAHKRKASCFLPENFVVARGWKHQGETSASFTYHPSYIRDTYLSIPASTKLLVGFNIKFDLMWELAQGNPDLIPFLKRGGTIWDGQLAEYLLGGQVQEVHMCSLNDTAPKYGGTTKIDAVAALWEAGVQTTDIPQDLLVDYLVGTEQEQRNGGDIRNTELVFLGQVKKAQELNMVKMIQDRMDSLLCSTFMEFYGLKIDITRATANLQKLLDAQRTADAELAAFIPTDLPTEIDFKWTRHQTSAITFGGTLRYKKPMNYMDEKTGQLARLRVTNRVLIGEFLSGKRKGEPKYRNEPGWGELKTRLTDCFYKFPGYTEPDPAWASDQVDGAGAPIYSVAGDTLDVLGTRDIPFTKAYTSKVALDKEIGTYYVTENAKGVKTGMLTCVQPSDHIIHHKLNHTSTVTSRLSSSDPNLQNLPRGDKSEVKSIFVSRFGPDGCMLEADYSQLEVVVQGVLSNDTELRSRLKARTDFHCLRVAKMYNITYEEALYLCKDENAPDHELWSKRRTGAKIFSFQRAYGAGAAKISAFTGIPVKEVEQMIETEETLFPGVVLFNANVFSAVKATAEPFAALDTETQQWKKFRRGYWQAPTGTRYSFRSYSPPSWTKNRDQDTFMPTELKNYPVQGTGGEFVQGVAMGSLFRHFVERNFYNSSAYMVNTVHDCIWVDCKLTVALEVAADVKRIMESIPAFYNSRHGMAIDVPFPVDVKVGRDMYKMKELHI